MIAGYRAINREAIWAALFSYLQAKLTAPGWSADTAYAAGQIVTDPQGHLQQAVTAGTSGAAAPAWNDNGGTAADGSGETAFTWQDTGPGFVSMGRRHVAPPDLVFADQPACFVLGVKETHNPKPRGLPNRLTLHGFLIIYAPAPGAEGDIGTESQLAATMLNGLFQAIDAALLPDNLGQGTFTIGGLVSHCWIEGETDQDPGLFTDQAAAILPIHILVP